MAVERAALPLLLLLLLQVDLMLVERAEARLEESVRAAKPLNKVRRL